MIIAGAAALGAAAGIVMAPRRGTETLDNIKDFMKSHYPGLKRRRLQALAEQVAREAHIN